MLVKWTYQWQTAKLSESTNVQVYFSQIFVEQPQKIDLKKNRELTSRARCWYEPIYERQQHFYVPCRIHKCASLHQSGFCWARPANGCFLENARNGFQQEDNSEHSTRSHNLEIYIFQKMMARKIRMVVFHTKGNLII